MEHCQNCVICIEKRGEKKHEGDLMNRNSGKPWERLYVDLWGPIAPVSRRGNKFVLTIKDAFSRFVILEPIASKDGKTVAEAMARVMVGFGIPNEIYLDNGLEFKNQLQAAMSRCFGYSQKFTIPHSPWTNRAERTHATLGSVLRILMSRSKRGPDTWDEVIPLVAGLINQRVCAATGVAPNDLIFTFRPCHPVDLIAKNADKSKGGTLPEFLREVRNGYEILSLIHI